MVTVNELRTIALEGKKVPHYTRRHKTTTIATILDKEGLHTYYFGNGISEHLFKPMAEVTNDDLFLLAQKINELNREPK